jgi:hypothetical protein
LSHVPDKYKKAAKSFFDSFIKENLHLSLDKKELTNYLKNYKLSEKLKNVNQKEIQKKVEEGLRKKEMVEKSGTVVEKVSKNSLSKQEREIYEQNK